MFEVLLSGRRLLYALVPEWWSSYECRCELNVPSPAVLANFSHLIVAKTDPPVATWRIAVCKFSVFVLATFMACARDGFCSRWAMDTRIRSRSASGVLFPLPNRVVRLVDDKDFMKLLEDLSLNLTHAFLPFRPSKEVDWFKSSYVGWFPYSFTKTTVERVEEFAVLCRKTRY